jgi:F-type H+-transporting ATPase subunit epsilon
MSDPLKLRVTIPTRVVLDREVTYVQAEDPSGRFGILPRHEPYLTAVVPSILVYRYNDGGGEREGYIALRHGVLRVTREGVEVAVREAHPSNDLASLQEMIRRSREGRDRRSYRSIRSLYQMQLAAWRRLMEYEDVRTR